MTLHLQRVFSDGFVTSQRDEFADAGDLTLFRIKRSRVWSITTWGETCFLTTVSLITRIIGRFAPRAYPFEVEMTYNFVLDLAEGS